MVRFRGPDVVTFVVEVDPVYVGLVSALDFVGVDLVLGEAD